MTFEVSKDARMGCRGILVLTLPRLKSYGGLTKGQWKLVRTALHQSEVELLALSSNLIESFPLEVEIPTLDRDRPYRHETWTTKVRLPGFHTVGLFSRVSVLNTTDPVSTKVWAKRLQAEALRSTTWDKMFEEIK